MATILVTIRYGLAARNVLRTGILTGLLRDGHRVAVVCPAAREQYLHDELRGCNIVLEPYPRFTPSIAEQTFAGAVDSLLMDHPGVTKSLTVKWIHLLTQRRYVSFVVKALLSPLHLQKSGVLRRVADRVHAHLANNPGIAEVFDRLRPDMVITTDVFSSEAYFVAEARRRHIPSVGLVKSWDNLTSKGRIPVAPDHLVVWSALMRHEAARLHHIPAERVVVGGAPNFDLLVNPPVPFVSRAAFLERIGAPSNAKLVVYSPGYKFTRSDDDNIRMLRRLLDEIAVGQPVHLHVRKYPKSPQTFEHLRELGITIEDAGVVVPAWDDSVDQQQHHVRHLGELMLHCDVLVHLGSTIALDAACFNTPTIGFALDSRDSRLPWSHYARRIFTLTHNRYLEDSGGIRVVRTESELAHGLRQYLIQPEEDTDARGRMARQIAGEIDGRAGERIATFLSSVVEHGSTSAAARVGNPVSVGGGAE
jgi:hypothetical protein